LLHLHTEYERELVPLFVKVLDGYMLRSKLDDDTVDRFQVITRKLTPQFPEKGKLLGLKAASVRVLVVVIVPIHSSDTAAVAATNSLNGVRTHENSNVIPDRPLANIKFVCQICAGVIPSQAQHFQQLFASLTWAHMFTPFHGSLTGIVKSKGAEILPDKKFNKRKFVYRPCVFIFAASENWKV